jgi:membrane fusion protein (multidrug efflux system)
MKNRFYFNYFVIAVFAIILSACSSAPKDKKTQLAELKSQHSKLSNEIRKLELEIARENPGTDEPRYKEVAVVELTPKPFDYFMQTQGSIEAVDNILVSARTGGVISQVMVKEGDVVTKGQVLAQIDNSITLRSIEEVKSQLELARTVYERQKNLWDQKIGTEVQYLQAKNNKESMEKRLATLNEQLDMSRVKSPINGSVDEVSMKIGQNAAPGLPAFRVVSSDKLKMKANVSESYVTAIAKGNKTTLTFSDINKTIDAQVTFVGRTINQLSRTFAVEVALPPNGDLRPNMTGVLRIIFDSKKAAIVVPVNVVQEVNKEKIVYTVETQNGKTVARRNVVEVSGIYGNLAEITKGLKAGDKIITVGYQGLNDGEIVKL